MNLIEIFVLRFLFLMYLNVLVIIFFLVILIKVNCFLGKLFKVCLNVFFKYLGGFFLMDFIVLYLEVFCVFRFWLIVYFRRKLLRLLVFKMY